MKKAKSSFSRAVQVGICNEHAYRQTKLYMCAVMRSTGLGNINLAWVVLMVLFNQPGSEAAYAWMETQMFLDEPEPVH